MIRFGFPSKAAPMRSSNGCSEGVKVAARSWLFLKFTRAPSGPTFMRARLGDC